jgi:hypothetical protein
MGTRPYKKQNFRDIMNYRYSNKAITRKQMDTILNMITLLFNIEFGKSNNGSTQIIRYIERSLEKLALINNIDFFKESTILDNVESLVMEISITDYLIEKGRSKLLRTDLSRMGFHSHSIDKIDRISTIGMKMMKIYKELSRQNYKGVQGPTKMILDNLQKVIDIIVVND